MTNRVLLRFVPVPGDPDKTKEVFIPEGNYVGTIFRGWLLLGGAQWVFSGPDMPNIGYKTLHEAKKDLLRRAREKGLI